MEMPGNGFHINMSVTSGGDQALYHLIAGVLNRIKDMTVFLNPVEVSYARMGKKKAPRYLTWSHENRSQLVRVPAAVGEYRRAELRSPDPLANPYLAFTLLIYAGLEGLTQGMTPPPPTDLNLFTQPEEVLRKFDRLPETLDDARQLAAQSTFIRAHLPESIVQIYCR